MKRSMIKATCAVLTVALGTAALTGCGSKELDGTKTVATVNGEEIPLGVASFAVRYQQIQSAYYYSYVYSMYGMGGEQEIWDKEGDEEGITYGEQVKNETLETLEKMYLTRAKADEYELKLTEDEQKAIEEAAKSFVESNDEKILKQIGVSESDVKEYLELSTYYENAFDPVIADVEIEVTDEEAAQSRLTYSFLSTKDLEDEAKQEVYDKVEKLLKELQASEDPASVDMEALADEMDDAFISTSYAYGDDDTTLDEAVKEAAAGLSDGEVYDGVVEGNTGYFVVRLDKKVDEEATDSKRESLIEEKKQEAFDEIVQSWFDEAKITLKKGLWKQITLTDKEQYTMYVPEEETSGDAEDTEAEDAEAAATEE